MKKLILLLFIGGLLLPFSVKASLFGFQDGKFYDENQALKYICFMDNNCYDLNGVFGFVRELPSNPQVITPISNPANSNPGTDPLPQQSPITNEPVSSKSKDDQTNFKCRNAGNSSNYSTHLGIIKLGESGVPVNLDLDCIVDPIFTDVTPLSLEIEVQNYGSQSISINNSYMRKGLPGSAEVLLDIGTVSANTSKSLTVTTNSWRNFISMGDFIYPSANMYIQNFKFRDNTTGFEYTMLLKN